MTSRSWQYISCHWDACSNPGSNHVAMIDFCFKDCLCWDHHFRLPMAKGIPSWPRFLLVLDIRHFSLQLSTHSLYLLSSLFFHFFLHLFSSFYFLLLYLLLYLLLVIILSFWYAILSFRVNFLCAHIDQYVTPYDILEQKILVGPYCAWGVHWIDIDVCDGAVLHQLYITCQLYIIQCKYVLESHKG